MQITSCLPPHGGSGLKWNPLAVLGDGKASPSTRREWIEIENLQEE